mmetsp:Transcript_50719/g.121157  ORF Transcript_50719/g.121157 Transcript_50719/m.121157 type:complete len:275 (+) Transcript_50719:33-857(+)
MPGLAVACKVPVNRLRGVHVARFQAGRAWSHTLDRPVATQWRRLATQSQGRRNAALCPGRLGLRRAVTVAPAPEAVELALLPARPPQVQSWVQRFGAVVARWPVVTAVLSCSIKAALADLVVQVLIERREKLDKQRNFLFMGFGGLVQGGFQYFLWNVIFERIWPGRSKLASFCKLAATNFISDPFFLFPSFYVMKEAAKAQTTSEALAAAFTKYRANCVQDWMMSWMVWLPGHYVTYFWLPLHLRVPWVAVASFSYIGALSYVRGGSADQTNS